MNKHRMSTYHIEVSIPDGIDETDGFRRALCNLMLNAEEIVQCDHSIEIEAGEKSSDYAVDAYQENGSRVFVEVKVFTPEHLCDERRKQS